MVTRWGKDFRSSPAYVCVVVCFAIFTDTFLYSVIVPITPFALRERAGASDQDVQWWTSIFLATFGAAHILASPIIGALSDRYASRRGPFMLGIVLLGLSTGLFWVGRSLWLLVAARALQGISGTIVWVVGMAMINDVSGAADFAIYMSWTWTVNTVGSLSGPAIGGLLFTYLGYHSIFAVAIALITLDIVLRTLLIEHPSFEKEDDQVTERSSLLPHDDASSNVVASDSDSSSQHTPFADLAPSPPCQAGYGFLLRSARVDVLMLTSVINTVALTFFETTMPLFLMRLFHIDAGQAGLMFLPLTVPTLFSPLFGRATVRYGNKITATLGSAVFGACIMLMALVSHDRKSDLVVLGCLLTGCGLARSAQRVSTSTDLRDALSALIEAAEATGSRIPSKSLNGKAYGLVSMSCGIGVTCGPLISGYLVETTSWQVSALIIGISIASLTPMMLIWVGGPMKKRKNGADTA